MKPFKFLQKNNTLNLMGGVTYSSSSITFTEPPTYNTTHTELNYSTNRRSRRSGGNTLLEIFERYNLL